MITADDYLMTLRDLARECDMAADLCVASITEESVPAAVILMRESAKFKRMAEAVRWAINQNAYGVTEDEVTG